MQLAGLVRSRIPTPIRFARTWPSTRPVWATTAEAGYENELAIKHTIAHRSTKPTTAEDTGLRREEVGGIIIGVCVGLILLAILFYCCRRRHRSWSSDTESDWSVPPAQPTSQPPVPTHPRPPKAAQIAAPNPTSLHTASRPPPTQEKPPITHAAPVKTQRPYAIILTLADNGYDKAKSKSIVEKKDGRRYAKGHTGTATDRPRPVAWIRPLRRELPAEGVNTLQD